MMVVDAGSRRKLSLLEHLRRSHLRRATGLLRAASLGRNRELHLLEGDLHFPPDHPLAQRIADARLLQDEKKRRQAWIDLFDLFLPSLEGIRVTEVEFLGGRRALPGELAGPLPTGALLRRAWGNGIDGADPLPATGARVVRFAGAPPVDSFGWAPEELWLFERLRQPRTLAELERDRPMPAAALRGALRGLEALEVVGDARLPGHLAPSSTTASGELALRLRDRIAESLADEPLKLAPEEANRRLIEKLSLAGGQSHYELLEVAPSAEADDVQGAFERLARLVHPAQAERLGLSARREALEYLFERATDAYRILSDPDLRMRYDREQGIAGPGPAPTDATERRQEAERMARALFRQAQMEEESGEIYTALQLMEQTVRTDPRAEYFAALARLQARNPAWRSRALETYRRALELDPQNGAIRYAIGVLHEREGDFEQARHAFQSAAAATPPHPEARAALARLAAARESEGGRRLGRLFRRE